MKSIYTLVGMRHCGTTDIVNGIKGGETLELRREPGNRFDPNAVQVFYRDQFVAYIKGTEARKLAREMDMKHRVIMQATFRVTADRWPQVEVGL